MRRAGSSKTGQFLHFLETVMAMVPTYLSVLQAIAIPPPPPAPKICTKFRELWNFEHPGDGTPFDTLPGSSGSGAQDGSCGVG